MKKLAYILAATFALFACAKEEIRHPSEAQAPKTASAFEPIISVDQEINQVTFSVDSKAVIPVWLFQDKDGEFTERRAQNGLKRIFATAGDYKVRMQVMNASGITPDYVEKTFHIDNTIANFGKFITFLAGGTAADNTKDWHVDGETAGHMGCGPAGTDGLEWWSAAANDKAAFGVYEDVVTFGGDGAYAYDPGEDGGVYVNKGITVSPFVEQKGDATEDFVALVDPQTATYSFEYQGNDLYLVLPEKTLFPYIDNDAFWANPEFKVLSITRETLELVHDNGDIAWHFLLTSKPAAYVFKGFKYNADSNLWKPADGAHTFSFYYAPGWAQIADPEVELEGAEYTIDLPSATAEQWQAQFHIVPEEPVVLTEDKNYDFSVIINTNKALPGMTFKLTSVDSDEVFLFANREPIEAGETIYYLTDLKGINAPNGVKMVFDFGGNADGTVVSIANIVVKDHAIDDGTILPSDEPEDPEGPESGAHYDIAGATNFWRSMTYTMSFYTAHGNSWEGLPESGFVADDANYVYMVSMPEATDMQWQRQVAFHTNMSSSAENFYDFCCTLTSTEDIPGVTIKLVKEGDDNTFYFADRHDIKADEPFVYKMPNMQGIDMEAIALFFDFGGNPADTEVEIKDICFQLHQEPQGAGEEVVFDYNAASNLWKPVDAEGGHTYHQYTATGDGWEGLPNPEITQSGSTYSFTYESATTTQWQAQFFIIPDAAISMSAEKSYDFQCKVTLSEDVPGVTFKLTDTTNDNNFLFTERFDIEAYDEATIQFVGLPGIDAAAVKMVFDFGGCPAGTEVTIKDIILREHE